MAPSFKQFPSVFKIGWEQCILALIVAELLFIIANNPKNLIVLNSTACGGIMFNVNDAYGFPSCHTLKRRI